MSIGQVDQLQQENNSKNLKMAALSQNIFLIHNLLIEDDFRK